MEKREEIIIKKEVLLEVVRLKLFLLFFLRKFSKFLKWKLSLKLFLVSKKDRKIFVVFFFLLD